MILLCVEYGGYSTYQSVFRITMEAHRKHARSPAQAACPSCSPDVTPSLCRHLGRWTAMGSWSRDITEG